MFATLNTIPINLNTIIYRKLRHMEFLYPLFINDLKMVHDVFHQPYDGSSYSFKENKKSFIVISHSKALPNESFNKAYLEGSSTR